MASSELLKQIQAGRKLKKAETNDRSSPIVDTPKGSGGSGGAGGSSLNSPLVLGGGPPQLAGLFAGGMPKLKSAGQTKLAIPPILGKPPSIPRSDGSAAPTPARNVPPPKPPAPVPARPSVPPPKLPTNGPTPVVRPVPSLPSRKNDIGASSAPLPPRRAPPAMRGESPPATPPRPRTRSPVTPASPISRPIPAVPIRKPSPPVTSATKPRVAIPDKAPPPPPPRPSHVVAPSPGRTAPPPPRRPPPVAVPAAPIDSAARTHPPEPMVPGRSASSSVPLKTITPPRISQFPPPSRRPGPPVVSTNGDRALPSRRKIPSPPPNAGVHTFPVTDFPPPRDFKATRKLYNSGSQQGSNFDIGNL